MEYFDVNNFFNCCCCHSSSHYICALALFADLVCTVQWLPQCNQICMETIGSPGRLVGALAAPGKSLDKGAARGKSAPPVPSPLPGSLPTSIDFSPYVFLDASLGACLGRGWLLRQARTKSQQNF